MIRLLRSNYISEIRVILVYGIIYWLYNILKIFDRRDTIYTGKMRLYMRRGQ